MRKKDLLGIIGKSILKNDVSLQVLYENYYPIIVAILQPFHNETKIDGLENLSIIGNRDSFDAFLRANSLDVVEKKIKEITKELYRWRREYQNKKKRTKTSDGAEQKQMRSEIVACLNDLISRCNLKYANLQRNKESYDTIIKRLISARDILKGIYLPRNNNATTDLYELLVSQIDEIDIEIKCANSNLLTISSVSEQVLDTVTKWEQLGN